MYELNNKTVFIDRDGTINQEGGYINHESRFVLIPGTMEALALLQHAGYKIIIITNQAGIANGYMTEELVNKIHRLFIKQCKVYDIKIEAIYYCPHNKHGAVEKYRQDCNCRKPKTGLIDLAMERFPVDPHTSYIIGDKLSDLQLGWNTGIDPILVMTGYGKGEYEYCRQRWERQPVFIAGNLLEAARWIVNNHKNIENNKQIIANERI